MLPDLQQIRRRKITRICNTVAVFCLVHYMLVNLYPLTAKFKKIESKISDSKLFSNEIGAEVVEGDDDNETGGQSLEGKESKTSGGFHNWRNLTQEEISSLSVLGRRLFLQEDIGTKQDKKFTILIWKTGKGVARRFIRQFGTVDLDPFRNCSVNNCELTYEDDAADTADAVLIHLHRTKGTHQFPNRTKYDQRWIWLTDESPYNTFMLAKEKNMIHYNGFFNWSMSYRKDSDVPVAYGRTLELTDEEKSSYISKDYFAMKPKVVAVMGSNCGGRNHRWRYVAELKKSMDVDAYGGCGTIRCPGHFTKDCEILKEYKFYLAFENGDCEEYITEKAWWNALEKGTVPVVMGGSKKSYKQLLPPNSFIHINDFQSPNSLAKYLLAVANDRSLYMKYHAWRSTFRIVNEHGYFGTDVYHYCRVCEALNYNDPAPKVYTEMEVFWNKKTQCVDETWQERMNMASAIEGHTK